MIYNFYEWLIAKHPTFNFSCQNFIADSPDNCTMVRLTGGPKTPNYPRQDMLIQILTRNKEDAEAYRIMYAIYETVESTFMETLPEATVKSVVYPSIIAAKIVPNQLPGAIGTDDEMRYLYSLNITVTTK